MSEIHTQKADNFLLAISKNQDTLISFAASLTKDHDTAYDLYSNSLLKCRDQIAKRGFNGESFVSYLISAIKCNYFYSQRQKVTEFSLSDQDAPMHGYHDKNQIRRNRNPYSSEEEFLSINDLLEDKEEDVISREEKLAFAVGVRAFIFAHYSTEEVAAFELHTQGQTLEEIVFLTDYKNKWQVHRVINRIKKEVRQSFMS